MRTLESYYKHVNKALLQCRKSYIVLKRDTLLGLEYIITPHLCKSNFCPVCRAKNIRLIRKALYLSMSKDKWRLITLTFPDHSLDILDQLKRLSKQFKRFIQRLKRRYPSLKFVRTVELHASKYPHIHMVVNSYIPVSLLTYHWRAVGGGIVDITNHSKCRICGLKYPCRCGKLKRAPSYKVAARYLTDELEKKYQDPHSLGSIFWQANVKPITTSRNFHFKKTSKEWSYVARYDQLKDAMYHYEELAYCAQWNEKPTPSIHYGSNSIYVSYGLSEP